MNKLLVALLLLTVAAAGAWAKPISWEPPTHREDNTLIKEGEIAGYKLRYGTQSGVYSTSLTINDGTARSYELDLPEDVDHYAVITTIDTGGRESKYSTEVILKASVVVPPVTLKPMPPTNLVIEQIGTTLEYRFTFTPPTKYEDGSDLVTVVVKYFLFNNGEWVRNVPADLTSFTRTLTAGDHLFDMETEIIADGKYIVSERSAMTAVVASIVAAPNPPTNIQ